MNNGRIVTLDHAGLRMLELGIRVSRDIAGRRSDGKCFIFHTDQSQLVTSPLYRKPEGPVYARCGSRDCDHVSSTNVHYFDSRAEFERWEESQYEGADGPISIREIYKAEYDKFVRENGSEYGPQRDHILEAFEDGHPWRVNV